MTEGKGEKAEFEYLGLKKKRDNKSPTTSILENKNSNENNRCFVDYLQ